MEKHVLLPSKIAMNILWIPVLDITLVSSVGLPLKYAACPTALSVHSLASFYTKPLLGLGGGHRRQIYYKRTLTYSCSPGTENIIKFKPAPDIDVEDLADKTDVNATSAIKLDLENPSDSFMNWFCCQVLKRVYGQMMQES